MRILELENISSDERSILPVYIVHPKFFFGEGKFIILNHNDVFCAIKIERKRIFAIGLLTGAPFSINQAFSEKEFLNELTLFLRQNKICDLLIHSLHFFTCSEAPTNSYVAEIGTLSVDLTRNKEEIFNRFAPNYRNEIRKVEKENVKINKEVSLDEYYKFYCEIQKRQNLATFPLSIFEDLSIQKEYETLLWTIEVNNSTEGFICIIVDGGHAYYFLGGSTFPTEFPGSNKLLHREAMFYLKEIGATSYELGGYRLGNMEGTKLKGVQEFKKRFGAIISKKNVFYTRIRPFKAWLYQTLLYTYLKVKKVSQNQQGIDYVYQKE